MLRVAGRTPTFPPPLFGLLSINKTRAITGRVKYSGIYAMSSGVVVSVDIVALLMALLP